MSLNQRQWFVLKVGVLLVVGNILFPPWTHTVNAKGIHSEKPAGYQFIFEPPWPERAGVQYGVRIDINTLLLQIFAVFLISAFGLIETRSRGKETTSEGPEGKTGDRWTE